ncbi:MAG TPA: ROK family protein [Ktedonosporobacter sp.]|nr:ROK family protein [Ktedonosporobacter sp.]
MQREQSVAVAVDIGGGQTTVALIDHDGRVRYRCSAKTLRGRPVLATLDPYLRAIDTMLEHAQKEDWHVCGVGVSVPGSLDHTSRRPLLVSMLPSLNSFPLCDLLETRYQLPTQLHVDVDAALLGEYHFGAGQGCRRLLFLTINAVVGAALAIDGQVERSSNYTGHICHLPIATNGPRCSCGKRGCMNTLISMDAMQKMVQRALRRGEETSLTQRLLESASSVGGQGEPKGSRNREYFSAQLLAEEAMRGDSVAQQIYAEVGRGVGSAVARYVGLFEPHRLILSGGVLSAGNLLLTQVRRSLSTPSSSRVCSMVEVVPSLLGNDAALVGSVAPIFS